MIQWTVEMRDSTGETPHADHSGHPVHPSEDVIAITHPSPEPSVVEKVAYWFFRLNGCLTIENFVVHPDSRGSQRTDADILGVRFPARSEHPGKPMKDHPKLLSKKPLLFLAEVKSGKCALNGPWTDPEKKNMQRVLSAVGLHSPEMVERVARHLYEKGHYEDDQSEVRLYAVGNWGAEELTSTSPGCVPLTWQEIIEFIHGRFRGHRRIKAHAPQWDRVGAHLYQLSTEQDECESFVYQVREYLGLPTDRVL